MNKKELIEKLQDIEWQDFEVKEAKSEVPKSAWETVSAFCNTAGGWLVFGVSKRGKDYTVVGVDSPEKIAQDFLTALRGDKFNKKIRVESKKYVLNGRKVLAFYIPSMYPKDKPVYFNSLLNTFIRTGSGDQRATKEEIDALYRNSSFDKKDEQATECHFEDLDTETVSRYRTYLKTIEPSHRYNAVSAKKMLELMQVIKDGKVTVGGVLIFGTSRAVNRVISDFRVEYLEVAGTSYADAPARYEYRMPIQKNLYEYYFSIAEKLMKHVHVPFKLKGMSSDENQSQVVAIREALVNLLMHTDYYSNAKPRIRVLSDRIEFFNPGALPKDIKYILKEEFSMPRNNVVAKVFRTIRLSENIGSGFHKMFSGWTSYYAKKPVVEGDFDYYKIVFYLERNVPEKSTRKVPEKYQKILDELIAKPDISRNELSKKLKEEPTTIQSMLRRLVKDGLIKRVGPDKGGSWKVLK
ncbi:MAG TPA: RNA-binding domain-containing protein [Candidatus Nanoarchaeia archaeon]|nr:RNA-binding domain-containing protein [Candidatus Nanoarchaeia archaeon]